MCRVVASCEVPVTSFLRKHAHFQVVKGMTILQILVGSERPSFPREQGSFREYLHVNFQYISGFPEHQRKAATVHQRSHCSAVVKLDCVSTHREEIMVEIRWKLGIIWREKDFLYSFSSYFMLRGKSQSDRKGNVERLLFLLL